jgi:long-chain acyl-CoA synthetase
MKLIQAIKNQPPDHIALQDATNVIRYGELLSCINDRAQDLVDTDVKVLGLALDNSVEWVLWDLAAQQAGVVCVPLAPFFSPDQTKHVMESAGITYIIDPQGLRASGLTVANGFSNIPAGTHKITYTSGTTGAPKGVCLPQSAMDNVAESIVGFLGDTRIAKGSHLCVLPLSVLLENVAGVYAALMAGCSIRFTALSSLGENYSELHTLLSNTKATSIILVPEILRSLMAQVLAKGLLPDLNFIAVGGAKIDPALLDQAEHLGLPVYEGYGLSECGSVVSLNTPEESRRGSVGKLLPHIHARIEAGEVLITDPGFLGYLGEPMVDDFATGDLGGLCADGYLSITGRKKNVLITAYGRNISPEWLESLLLSPPHVAQPMV